MIIADFKCFECEATVEDLVDSSTKKLPCECGGFMERLIGAPHVASMNDPSVREAALRKRSDDHSKREARKNPESIAAKLGGKPKPQATWNLRSK